ncbi:MAG: nucleotidyltransferase domain-containing protein [Oscillospiraceae bacterium]|jgi:predicted nucleotidyltransferase|nr:nucleotidyltransferase domain-containing protein [Oscillospiraceae bacterium]
MREEALQNVLRETKREFRNMFGNSLVSVLLYGSYARGDYVEDSDVDVVALVDAEREVLQAQRPRLVRLSEAMDMQYSVLLSPSVIPYREFLKYQNDLPYYKNIAKEGVRLDG